MLLEILAQPRLILQETVLGEWVSSLQAGIMGFQTKTGCSFIGALLIGEGVAHIHIILS